MMKVNGYDIKAGVDLQGTVLWDANLRGADLRYADLYGANLRGADLRGADLRGANPRYADLRYADLYGANLRGADLRGANPRYADLRYADLYGANLRGADLRGADLRGADLSNTKGLSPASRWMKDNFECTSKGYIVYKAFGETPYADRKKWGKIRAGRILTETVNPCRTIACGCGVNFATKKWIENNYKDVTIYKCLIKWENAVDIIVPYNTDGKARCGKLKLLSKE